MNRTQSAPVWWLIGLVLVASVGCDQFTKRVAQNHLKGQPVASYWGDTFRLQYAENPGAFLGLGQDLPGGVRRTLLVGVNLAIATALAAVMVVGRRMGPWRLSACALLLAGAIGNLIDRVQHDGLVIDFMNLGVGPLRSGIFNVADVAISVGAVALALCSSRNVPKSGESDSATRDAAEV